MDSDLITFSVKHYYDKDSPYFCTAPVKKKSVFDWMNFMLEKKFQLNWKNFE